MGKSFEEELAESFAKKRSADPAFDGMPEDFFSDFCTRRDKQQFTAEFAKNLPFFKRQLFYIGLPLVVTHMTRKKLA